MMCARCRWLMRYVGPWGDELAQSGEIDLYTRKGRVRGRADAFSSCEMSQVAACSGRDR